jgi:acyl carrier protein
MNLEKIIFNEIRQIAAETASPVGSELNRDTKVFDSGLDSLGFAVLVAKLEETLGYDPFVSMAEPIYPVTLGEFVDMYETHESQR